MAFERIQGRLLRSFSLPALDGSTVDTFRFRGRQSLIALFHDGVSCGPCADWLRAMAADERFSGRDVQVLSVSAGLGPADRALAEELAPRVQTLFDEGGKIRAALELGSPGLLLTDVYSEIFAVWQPDTDYALPPADMVSEWLTWIEAQCAACSSINLMGRPVNP